MAETCCTIPTVMCALADWRPHGKVRTTRSIKILLSLLLEGQSSTIVCKTESDHGAAFGAVHKSQICYT